VVEKGEGKALLTLLLSSVLMLINYNITWRIKKKKREITSADSQTFDRERKGEKNQPSFYDV
jgi:hypothetical protein